MPVSWDSANGLSKDEQIANCSLVLIPMLSKRQAEISRKILLKRETQAGSVITDMTIYALSSRYPPVRIYG